MASAIPVYIHLHYNILITNCFNIDLKSITKINQSIISYNVSYTFEWQPVDSKFTLMFLQILYVDAIFSSRLHKQMDKVCLVINIPDAEFYVPRGYYLYFHAACGCSYWLFFWSYLQLRQIKHHNLLLGVHYRHKLLCQSVSLWWKQATFLLLPDSMSEEILLLSSSLHEAVGQIISWS